jgi:Eco57I restriction-modification methylase
MSGFDGMAKEALRKAIRGLRERLIEQLTAAAEGRYRLSLPIEKSQLPEAWRVRRERLEEWLGEQSRAAGKTEGGDTVLRKRLLQHAVKEAAYTFLNRLVIVRIMEQHGLLKPAVVQGGWKSPGYREFSEYASALVGDDCRGYDVLLGLVFDELAIELPGLFGPVGLTPLFPIPAATWRDAVDTLNDEKLEHAWGDDTTLGWIYQFWNDPERESLDAKIADGGKIAPHEIASKTQMFTERYMVEWLLQNSLGTLWLQICAKNKWRADFESVRAGLENRRAHWRAKRESGAVALDALMPIEGPLEDQWKYWVEQPVPAPDENTPGSVRDIKLLDPACGSGHFLVIAFDLLAALYGEEARHRGQSAGDEWNAEGIARAIVENNLHGVDIDPRAVQIAAAALWLKAKRFAPTTRITRVNLVAPAFKLAGLPVDDPARVRLQGELARDAGIPASLTETLLSALNGVDHLGTLLRVDREVEKALAAYQAATAGGGHQGDLFKGMPPQQLKLTVDEAKRNVLHKLGAFLDTHQAEQDLGLRLEGEQLAAGVRFVRMVQEGTYDVVVGNPPFQGTSKMQESEWIKLHYPRSKADLYACFLERAIELIRDGGTSALVTMRGWMFLSQFEQMRQAITGYALRLIGDIDKGGFESMPTSQLISVAMVVVARTPPVNHPSVALQPSPPEEKYWDRDRTARKRATILCQFGRYTFDVKKLAGIEGTPLVYWWDDNFLNEYIKAPKLASVADARRGATTGDNKRFVRLHWELDPGGQSLVPHGSQFLGNPLQGQWVPYVLGAKGRKWFDDVRAVVKWASRGLELKASLEHEFGEGATSWKLCNEPWDFKPGIAYSTIGNAFSARAHTYHSVLDVSGASIVPFDSQTVANIACVLNSSAAEGVLNSLNPSVNYQLADLKRLTIGYHVNAGEIWASLQKEFSAHESHREPSVEFKSPGPTPWRHAQDWAQLSVDRPKDAPLPDYVPQHDSPDPEANLSYALGIALGRFGANAEGILDTAPPDTLPGGILFLCANPNIPDSLSTPPPNATAAIKRITTTWDQDAPAILKSGDSKATDLNEYLRRDFFKYHKPLYENRPIYFPLSSANRNFVAWCSIHRFKDNTLQTLLTDHLNPALRQLEGEIADLNRARAASDKKQQAAAEKQYERTKTLLDELKDFIATVTQIAEKGAPPTDGKCKPRDTDAPFRMDLDDGVMINSAALWPLLAPQQWKDPAKWWKELSNAEGKADYDWAHLAARYWPTRVDAKCQKDPSLAVAHKCFWRYHPERAHAWELRLQDEIKPDFTIDEPDSNEHRERFLTEHPKEAAAVAAKEQQRRERGRKKAGEAEDAADKQGKLI